MALRFERFIAGRYFRKAQGREEGRRFVRFITYVAVGGVAVGVASLLLALSIVRGFSQEIQEKIIGFGAHVQVESFQDAPLQDATMLRDSISAWPGVVAVDPVVQQFALMRRTAAEIDGVILWGVERPPPFLAESLLEGSFDLTVETGGLPRVVIGADLARLLNVGLGETLTAFSMRGAGDADMLAAPRLRQFIVSGIYQTFLQNFDELYVLVNLESVRSFFDYDADEVTRLDITLDDPARAEELVARIEQTFGFPVMARTIFEVHRGLFAWVELQENIIPLVISVIILVAAFNIIATLMMLILEKTREIGVMGSLGVSPSSIQRLFLLLGLFIGIFGVAIGSVIAFVTGAIQDRFGVIPLPAEAYYIDRAPIDMSGLDFLIVGGIAVTLCLLAAYVPARVAARIEPVRAIKLQ